MQQLSKSKAVLYHLYPGIVITIGFILLAPFVIQYGFPPQFGMLLSIVLTALPILLMHLMSAKKKEQQNRIIELNGFTNRLPARKLILCSLGLVLFAFLAWGATQPVSQYIADKLFYWLPHWYTVQDFNGYDAGKIKITLVLNLLLNGFLAPYVEELYFRGYLLPRMKSFGKTAFIVNTLLFSVYHFWQPHIYLTLMLSLLPMTYLTWKTKDLRLAIFTHCLLNLIGAILFFGLLMKS